MEVVEVLIADAIWLARHRFAVHVFELALKFCEEADQARLVQASVRRQK